MDYKDTYVMYRSKMIYDYYIIVDTDKFISRRIFKENGIRVTILDTLKSSDSNYRICSCRTKRKNREIFDKCIQKLCNNMLIVGNRDYIEFSKEVITNLLRKKGNDTIVECTGVLLNNYYIVTIDADSINHKEFIVFPNDNRVVTFQYIADKVKHLIDMNKLEYRKLTINVKNLYSKEEKTFNYINE